MSREIHWASRILIGAVGGLCSTGAKFLAQDFSKFQQLLDTGEGAMMTKFVIGYVIICAIIVMIGAVIAWAHNDEVNIRKLLMLSVSGPAMFTTVSGGGGALPARMALDIFPSAHASTIVSEAAEPSVWDGVKFFFGVEKPKFFRVVVGSYPDAQSAQAAVDKFNTMDPGIGARVGGKRDGNNFVSVVVSDYLPYEDAKARLEEARKSLGVSDAFLAPSPW